MDLPIKMTQYHGLMVLYLYFSHDPFHLYLPLQRDYLLPTLWIPHSLPMYWIGDSFQDGNIFKLIFGNPHYKWGQSIWIHISSIMISLNLFFMLSVYYSFAFKKSPLLLYIDITLRIEANLVGIFLKAHITLVDCTSHLYKALGFSFYIWVFWSACFLLNLFLI